MSLVTVNKKNHSVRTGAWPKAERTFFATTRRRSPELSTSELRGIVIELLG